MEAALCGPVQYRWMYPFERYFNMHLLYIYINYSNVNRSGFFRFLRRLKNTVGNKARVEGSICSAYIVQETSTFCSYYF
ncbi:DUF4218 domain-containing protein, partial [Vibrio vulnificus]|nr:DUF4218 domain-containing protein [Vibrio vulnificus]